MISESNSNMTARLAKKTAKSASFLVVGKILSLLIQAIMFVVVARLLNPSGYGIYTLILSIAAFFSAFGSLNIGTYLNERVPFLLSRKRHTEIKVAFGDSLVAVSIPGILLFAVGSALSVFLSVYVLHSASYAYLIILGMSSIIFSLLFNTFNLILVSYSDGKNTALSLIIYSIAQAVFSIGLVVLGFGIAGAIIGYTAGLIISLIFEVLAAHRSFGISIVKENMGSRIKEMLTFSMPLTYSNIITTLVTNFSVILLGIVVLPSFVGQYGVASRIGSIIDVFAGSFAIVLIPMFAEAIHSKGLSGKIGKFFHYATYFGLLFTAPMIAYVTIFANYLITTLFTPTYSSAVLYMQLIGIGLLLSIFGSYATQLVISTRKTSKVFKYSLIVGIIETISLLILVPLLHVIGVIIAMLYIGSMATNLLFMNYLKAMGIRTRMGQLWKVLFSNIILAASLFAFLRLLPQANRELMILAGIALSLLIYPPIIAKSGAASRKDVLILRDIVSGIPLVEKILGYLLNYTLYFL